MPHKERSRMRMFSNRFVSPRAQQAVRDQVRPVLTAGWADAANVLNPTRAVRIMKLEALYAEQLKGVPNS